MLTGADQADALRLLQDLRGRIVRLVFTADAEPESRSVSFWGRSSSEVTTVLITNGASTPTDTCSASDPDAWSAYGIISATAVSDMPGTEFLIDSEGFLRLTQRPSETSPSWNDPEVLRNIGRMISTDPISQPSSGQHHHH